jgi:hypothetical protein
MDVNRQAEEKEDAITLSPGARLRAAMVLAILADVFQMVIYPLFFEGFASPAEDALDLGIGIALITLLGWHWEFLPSFIGKLVPGVDMVPLWTIAVARVYKKSKQAALAIEGGRGQNPPQAAPRNS